MSKLCLCPKSSSVADFYKSKTLDEENAGFDLFVPEDVSFAPGQRKFVGMGVSAAVVDPVNGFVEPFWLAPRSSISKTGLMMMNSVGVIDKGYRGELIAALWNTLDREVIVNKGDRLVQVVSRDMTSFSEVLVTYMLPESQRGSGGFGSTGK
jgi:dUTP pyrophosphatase